MGNASDGQSPAPVERHKSQKQAQGGPEKCRREAGNAQPEAQGNRAGPGKGGDFGQAAQIGGCAFEMLENRGEHGGHRVVDSALGRIACQRRDFAAGSDRIMEMEDGKILGISKAGAISAH